MGLTNGELSAADIAAVTGNGNFGNGFGGDGAFWLIILFLFALGGNGWGNNFGGNGSNGYSAIQQGFDQAAVTGQLAAINSSINNGFANAEVSRCNTQANLTNQLNTIAMAQQNCCCENRSAVADLKYTISNEEAATRAANAANTQAILDKLCQQEIEALKVQNQNLQTQLNMATLRESQSAQTATILANNAAQTQALEQYLNPAPIPAYVVQNPNCCSSASCGCGSF